MTYWPCEDAPELLKAARLLSLSHRTGIPPAHLMKMSADEVERLWRWLSPLIAGADG